MNGVGPKKHVTSKGPRNRSMRKNEVYNVGFLFEKIAIVITDTFPITINRNQYIIGAYSIPKL